jgi:hypothetical protein
MLCVLEICVCVEVLPSNFNTETGKYILRKIKQLSSWHFIYLYARVSPQNHLCGLHTFANLQVVPQIRHKGFMHLDGGTKC